MAHWKRMEDDWWLIVLETGDEVIGALTEFARAEGIGAGHFSGIGAVGSAELGHYDVDRQKYSWQSFAEPLEVVSLTGNVAEKDAGPLIHAHVVVGNDAMASLGGHLKTAVVSATCEIVLHQFQREVRRKPDAKTGLSLMDIG